jgi:hypothetical protein
MSIRYKKKKEGSNSDHYTFYCAQYEKEIAKKRLTDNVNKQRARLTMDRFDCRGYLHVSVPQENAEEVRIKLAHCEAHLRYVNIEIDAAMKKRVEELKDLPPYAVSTFTYGMARYQPHYRSGTKSSSSSLALRSHRSRFKHYGHVYMRTHGGWILTH